MSLPRRVLRIAALAPRTSKGFPYGPPVWAPNLDSNTCQICTIYKKPTEQTSPECNRPITRAHRKNLGGTVCQAFRTLRALSQGIGPTAVDWKLAGRGRPPPWTSERGMELLLGVSSTFRAWSRLQRPRRLPRTRWVCPGPPLILDIADSRAAGALKWQRGECRCR